MTRASTFTVEDPATLTVVGQVAEEGAEEARRAVDAAHQGLVTWSRTTPRRRSEVLHRTFDLMLRDQQALSKLITRENGKSTADAHAEISYAADFFRWYAEEAVRFDGTYGEAPSGGARSLVHHRPVGVAALVTPWNFPAAMITRKVAPALAAGCTAVLKPAAETPLTALAIADLLHEAGLPEGTLSIVTTTDPVPVVSAWLEDDRVRKISFTGSTAVGRLLLRQAADRVVNSSMELGGNAPVVVTADARLDEAVTGTMVAKFRNAGQACTAANRIYVHADVIDEFTALLGHQVEGLSVGPAAEGHDIGPLIDGRAVERVAQVVQQALDAGARVAHQAASPGAPGHFYAPVVLTDVPPEADILRREIFGPVAPIVAWTDEDELIRRVNDTELGLAAYVFAGDLQHALRLGERIEAGMVGINRGVVSDPSAPFGGVKHSGLGREGAREGMREFQETQYFSVAWDSGRSPAPSGR